MDLQLRNKVAVVAGSTRGIGLATARALAAEGCRLVLGARGEEGLAKTAAELRGEGAEVHTLSCDLFEPDGPECLIREAEARFGQIDVLVNVVGGSSGGTFRENQIEDFEEGFNRNFWPALRASRAALPALEKSRGVIIQVGSIWGREAGGLLSYNVAKAALQSLAKGMGRELAPHGVRVVCVAPGSVLHPGGSWERRKKEDPEKIARFVEAELPPGRFGKAEEIGDVIAFLASPRASWVNATCVVIDGGQSRAF